MPTKKELTMRQMLQLTRDGVSAREIVRPLRVARSTIRDNLKQASTAGLAWPLAGDLTDAVPEQHLFAQVQAVLSRPAGIDLFRSSTARPNDPDYVRK